MLRRKRTTGSLVALLLAVACGGGGSDDGGTAPVSVASVVITAPGSPPSFQTFTRTVQFAAEARTAGNAVVGGATITWGSSNTAVATASGSGLVTAVGNGTAQITASTSGITSTAVTVTVAQVTAAINVTPAAVAFGYVGSTRQLTAAAVDSSGAAMATPPAITWTRAGAGTTASVSAGGFATALAVGSADTAVATGAGKSGRSPISVTQVPASLLIGGPATDTLRTTGSVRVYPVTVRDSANVIFTAPVTWGSSATGVATVTGTSSAGTATAVADGSTTITATSGTATHTRALAVRRFASTFTLAPTTATITTALGTQLFLGTAQDSNATTLPITWTTRTAGVVSLSSATAPSMTATAAGNGTTYLVLQGGTRSDSALITVTGQSVAPLTATVLVGNNFFRSQRNNSQNAAVDTVAVGGTVTWEWVSGTHSVQSQGAPSFPSSGNQVAGSYVFTFASTGTFQYDCAIHGSSMSGRVVVR